jgi:hypothetical protein
MFDIGVEVIMGGDDALYVYGGGSTRGALLSQLEPPGGLSCIPTKTFGHGRH